MVDTVVITGAGRGIGFETARLAAHRGFAVIGIARNAPESFPGIFLTCDLADRSATAEVLANIAASHQVSGLVNCAGLNVPEPLGSVSLEHFDQVLDLNLRTAVQSAQAFLPGMKERGHGRIVNIASRGALGRPRRTSYSAAKAGLIGMTRTWALELATSGITANVVSPGPTETEMFRRNNLEGPDAEKNRRYFLADVPMGRFGKPEEIAAAIVFFLGRESSFITGQVLHVCGGSSVGPAPL